MKIFVCLFDFVVHCSDRFAVFWQSLWVCIYAGSDFVLVCGFAFGTLDRVGYMASFSFHWLVKLCCTGCFTCPYAARGRRFVLLSFGNALAGVLVWMALVHCCVMGALPSVRIVVKCGCC